MEFFQASYMYPDFAWKQQKKKKIYIHSKNTKQTKMTDMKPVFSKCENTGADQLRGIRFIGLLY